eukprot:tig00020951_g16459.t1
MSLGAYDDARSGAGKLEAPAAPRARASLDGLWRFHFLAESERKSAPAAVNLRELPFGGETRVPGAWQPRHGLRPKKGQRSSTSSSEPGLEPVLGGAGVYRTSAAVEAAWAGRRLLLTLGEAHGGARVWAYGPGRSEPVHRPLAKSFPLSVDVTPVAVPGQPLEIVVAVENAKQGTDFWCGFSGPVALEAVPPLWIASLQATPSPYGEQAEVRVEGRVEGYDPPSGSLSVLLELRDPGGEPTASASAPVAPDGRFGPVPLRPAPPPALWRPGAGPAGCPLYSLSASLPPVPGSGPLPPDSVAVPLGFPAHALPDRGGPLAVDGVPRFLRAYHDDLLLPGCLPPPPGYGFFGARLAALAALGFDLVAPSSYPSGLISPALLDAADRAGLLVSAVAPDPPPAARHPCLLRGKLVSGDLSTSSVPCLPGSRRPALPLAPVSLRFPLADPSSLSPGEAKAAALCAARDLHQAKEAIEAARAASAKGCAPGAGAPRGVLFREAGRACARGAGGALPDRLEEASAALGPALARIAVLRDASCFPASLRRGAPDAGAGAAVPLLLHAAEPVPPEELAGARLLYELRLEGADSAAALSEGSFPAPAALDGAVAVVVGDVPLAAALAAGPADRPAVLSLSARLVGHGGTVLAANEWRAAVYPSARDVIASLPPTPLRLAVTGGGPEGETAASLLGAALGDLGAPPAAASGSSSPPARLHVTPAFDAEAAAAARAGACVLLLGSQGAYDALGHHGAVRAGGSRLNLVHAACEADPAHPLALGLPSGPGLNPLAALARPRDDWGYFVFVSSLDLAALPAHPRPGTRTAAGEPPAYYPAAAVGIVQRTASPPEEHRGTLLCELGLVDCDLADFEEAEGVGGPLLGTLFVCTLELGLGLGAASRPPPEAEYLLACAARRAAAAQGPGAPGASAAALAIPIAALAVQGGT